MTQSLPFSVRHGYGAGALGLSLANTAVMFFLLKYLVDGAGLSPATAGAVILAGKAWDAFSDPIIGRLSDRTRTRWGARRPWIAAGTIPFVGAFAALWWGIPVSGPVAGFAYAALFIAYSTAYTAVVVPYGALTPTLTNDYDERTRLNAARMGWSMVGGLVAGIGLPVILGATDGSWRIAGLALAAAAVAPLLWTVVATRGRDRSEASPQTPTAMWTVLRNPGFRRVVLLFVAGWTSIAALSAIVPFYVEQHLQRPDLLDATFAAIQVSALLCIPGVAALAKRIEKHRAYAWTIASFGVALVGLALMPRGTGWPAVAYALLVGPGVAAAHVLPWAMLPDVVDADRAATGAARDGAFYGVMTFVEKAATAVALGALGVVLEAAGYVEGAASQPESARLAILVAIGPVPAVALAAAAVFALARPPITRAGFETIRTAR